MQSSLSSEDEDSTDEIEVTFGARRPGDLRNVFYFSIPQNGIN